MTTVWFLVVLSVVAGGMAVLVGTRSIGRARRRRAVVRRCLPARAVVTSVDPQLMRRMVGGNVTVWAVGVRYQDGYGVVRDSMLAISRSWKRLSVGQVVDVLYDSHDPAVVLTPGNDALLDVAGPVLVGCGTVVMLGTMLLGVFVVWLF